MQDVRTILPLGSVVRDRYSIEDLLGKGGFGAVYLVRDMRVRGNQFALKEIIDSDKQERDRFTFECEVLKRLDHPSLPRVYRVFEDDKNGRAYMLMDYIEGQNLEMVRVQQPQKRLTLAQAMTIMAPIFNAVSYLHEQHPPIIHRDIKPANIIVPTAGDAVLVDFGIAKEYDQDTTTTAIRRCSPGYGAPEQYASGTNTRTDVYGLAATFYTLLTGSVPADALYRLTQMGSGRPDPLEPVTTSAPTVPAPVAAAIERALSMNSSDRFASVDDFWRVLNEHQVWTPTPALLAVATNHSEPPVAESENVVTVAVYKRPQSGTNRRRGGFVLLLLALILVALVTGVAFGTGLLSPLFHSTHAASTVTTQPTSPVRHTATSTPTSAPTATPVPTSTPTATPTPPPTAKYPVLAQLYNGTIHNTPADVGTTLSLSQIVQNGATLSGYLTLYGSQLQGNGNFTGTVTTNDNIQFLVQSSYGHLPLLFKGQIASDGSMAGSYCSTRNGQCDYTSGGYGTWTAHAASTGSTSSSLSPLLSGSSTSPVTSEGHVNGKGHGHGNHDGGGD